MTTAIYPGSFDPVTVGHLDIIRRAAKLFDKVIVAVLVNMEKEPWFTIEERMRLLEKATAGISNIEIAGFEGLLVDFAAQRNASAIVKGLRAVSDFELSLPSESTWKAMFLSSSIVKQVGLLGGDISTFVPEEIKEDILLRIKQRSRQK